MAQVLLTGASGYLGAAIGAALLVRGIAYDALPGRLEQLDKKSLRGYQKVIHAAGATRRQGQVAIEQSNHLGTKRLLAALDGTPEVLFISSRLVYGHQPGCTCTEFDPALPIECYGKTKLAAEEAIKESRFPHAILRIPGLIGESPTGIGENFLADALRRFLAGETVFRFVPDRLHDNLDVRALALVCADWAGNAIRFDQGITNITGSQRSLHGTLAEFAAVAEQFGGRPMIQDQFAPKMPWPFMSDQRFRNSGGVLLQRPDKKIAEACSRKLVTDHGPTRPVTVHQLGQDLEPDRPEH